MDSKMTSGKPLNQHLNFLRRGDAIFRSRGLNITNESFENPNLTAANYLRMIHALRAHRQASKYWRQSLNQSINRIINSNPGGPYEG